MLTPIHPHKDTTAVPPSPTAPLGLFNRLPVEVRERIYWHIQWDIPTLSQISTALHNDVESLAQQTAIPILQSTLPSATSQVGVSYTLRRPHLDTAELQTGVNQDAALAKVTAEDAAWYPGRTSIVAIEVDFRALLRRGMCESRSELPLIMHEVRRALALFMDARRNATRHLRDGAHEIVLQLESCSPRVLHAAKRCPAPIQRWTFDCLLIVWRQLEAAFLDYFRDARGLMRVRVCRDFYWAAKDELRASLLPMSLETTGEQRYFLID